MNDISPTPYQAAHGIESTNNHKKSQEYEQVRIPLYKTNGQQMDTESFVRELRKFLRNKYNIESKVMTRGLGRCILAIGEK